MDSVAKTQINPKVQQILHESPLVILCGGQGTRLREETEWKPKPMVPVGEWPLLWHIMRYYACFGVRRFVLCLGYKGHIIREFFLNYHQQWADATIQLGKNTIDYSGEGYVGNDWEIILANTGISTKTAGRLSAVEKYLNTDTFLLTYGDGLSDVNLHALVDCHLRSGRLGTVTAVRPVSRFGELFIENGYEVSSFAEKPLQLQSWISGGFFVFDKGFLSYLPKEDVFLEEAPLQRLAEDRQLAAYQHGGFWQCVDTYRELVAVEKLWLDDKAPWKIW